MKQILILLILVLFSCSTTRKTKKSSLVSKMETSELDSFSLRKSNLDSSSQKLMGISTRRESTYESNSRIPIGYYDDNGLPVLFGSPQDAEYRAKKESEYSSSNSLINLKSSVWKEDSAGGKKILTNTKDTSEKIVITNDKKGLIVDFVKNDKIKDRIDSKKVLLYAENNTKASEKNELIDTSKIKDEKIKADIDSAMKAAVKAKKDDEQLKLNSQRSIKWEYWKIGIYIVLFAGLALFLISKRKSILAWITKKFIDGRS